MNDPARPGPPLDARRRRLRIEADGYCFLRDMSQAMPLEVVDISPAGMQVCGAEAMTAGERRVILATLAGLTVELRATVVHCAPWLGRGGHYRIGVAFPEDTPTAQNVAALIQYLTAVSRGSRGAT